MSVLHPLQVEGERQSAMKQIVPGSRRWRLAQTGLRLLFGPGTYYISPWQHAAVAAAAYIVHDGRLLMARRGPSLEHPGKLDVVGGHVDIETGESVLEALCREAREEVGLAFVPEDFPPAHLLHVELEHGQDYHRLAGAARMGLRYWVRIDDAQAARIRASDEALEPRFLSFTEVERAFERGELVQRQQYDRAVQMRQLGLLSQP